MADSQIFTTDPVTGADIPVSSANPLPITPPVKTMANELTGVISVVGIWSYITLDLGILAPYYTWAAFSQAGIVSNGSTAQLKGSSDNVNFYYLPQIGSISRAIASANNDSVVLMARTIGHRYLQARFFNSSVAQTGMYLRISAG